MTGQRATRTLIELSKLSHPGVGESPHPTLTLMPEFIFLVSIPVIPREYRTAGTVDGRVLLRPACPWADGRHYFQSIRGKLLLKDMLRVSVFRSAYLSARHGGRIIIMRGARVRIDRGAHISVPAGGRLIIGQRHGSGSPTSLDMRHKARLTICGAGRVSVSRGTTILILDEAELVVGHETAILYNSTITCLKRISIGHHCAISWNVNIFDGNAHELIVDGVPRSRSRPVDIGNNVWIGSGSTVMGAVLGDGSVIGTGSVVVSDVPPQVAVAGNPARVLRKNVSWVI